MPLTDVLDRFRGFALDSQLTDTEIRNALDDGTLVVHETFGDTTVYRQTDLEPDMPVSDYWPTVMALSRADVPEPGRTPGFIFADSTALRIRDCGVLSPQRTEILAHHDWMPPVSEGTQPPTLTITPGTITTVTITSGTFTDEDWSWEFGLPVMTALCAIRRLADNSGIEPTWLLAAVEDAYDEGLADFPDLAAAVNHRAQTWGYQDGQALIADMCPSLFLDATGGRLAGGNALSPRSKEHHVRRED